MATLHQDSRLPGQVQESDPEGALVVFESWDTGKYGLPEFHRSLFKEVCSRSGHNLKAFATILDDSVDEDQKADAGEVGITLIAGKRSELIDPKDDPVDKRWLIYHKSYYTALKDLKNINYVLGYAPFTAAAAADIRRSLFPQAKLYQINAVNPRYCADLTSEEQQKLEIDMLKIAEEADAVVSVGPSMYDYFENKYRAISNVSHIKLLPKAGEHFYKHDFSMPEDIRQLEILSFGAICARSVKALSDYAQLAVGIDEIASSIRQSGIRDINWNVIGIPKKDDGYVQNYLEEKMTRNSVKIGAFPECSPTDLVRWLKQCHMCLLPQSNINYGFMGLESIAVGVPTFLNGKSELSYFIDGHFKDNGSIFLVENNEQWKEKIQKMLNKPSSDSVCKQAVRLKEDFRESEEVRQSYDRFAAMFERCSTPSEDLPVSVGLDEQIWELYTQGVREEMKKSFKGELVAESGMVPNKMQELIQAYGTLLQMLKDNAEKAIQCADGKIKNLIRKCGHGVNGISGLNTSSLGMLLNFLGIVNLYRFKSSCENGRFARAFEPLLINDKMREIAERFNIPLKLKVTYNQAKFDAIDRFFCRRDGVLESTPNERGEFGEVVDNSKHYQRSSSQDEKGTRLPGHGIQAVESENSIVSGVKYGEGDINNGEPLPKKRRLAESMVTAATHLLAFKADKASSFLKHADMYLSSVFDILKCTTLKGQDWDFILVEVQTTEETQHILSTKQDILSLLGIREFLKIEMSSGINDVHGVAELFLESGRMIWHTGTPPKSPSLVVRSLIPYEASHAELEKYRMQYLLELGHAYCQEEIKGVIRQKEDAIAQLEENLMAAESRVKQFEGDEKSRSLRIGDLQDQFQKAIQEKASLQLQIKDARKEEAALKDLYKQEKERLEKACIKGKLDSRRVQDRLDKAVQEKGILEEKLTNAEQEVVVVKDLNKKQQNQLANANEEIRNQFIQLEKAKQCEATAQDLYQRKQQELSRADAIITSQLASIKELESKVRQSDVPKVDRATCTPSLADSVLEKMAEGISTGLDCKEDIDKKSDGKTAHTATSAGQAQIVPSSPSSPAAASEAPPASPPASCVGLETEHNRITYERSTLAIERVKSVYLKSGADEALTEAYQDEFRRLQSIAEKFDPSYPRQDFRLKSGVIFFLKNKAPFFVIERTIYEQFAFKGLTFDNSCKSIKKAAMKKMDSMVLSPEDMEKYKRWHEDYLSFRKAVSLLVLGLESYHNKENYLEALPYFVYAHKVNASLRPEDKYYSVDDRLISVYRRECLLQLNDQCVSSFESDDEREADEALKTVEEYVVPCLGILSSSKYAEDNSAAKDIKERWYSFLGQEINASLQEKFHDFVPKLIDVPDDAYTLKTPTMSQLRKSHDLGERYAEVMEVVLQSGVYDPNGKPSTS